MVFGFKYLEWTEKFTDEKYDRRYAYKLLERLKTLCYMKKNEMLNPRGNRDALRCHLIRWDETSEPDGFARLPAHLREVEPYQFSIMEHKHGRVHGFFIDEVFHIVWIDPAHDLYKRN